MNMEENFNALDVIARTRGKVELDSLPSGDRLFPLWGGLAAVFYLAEFLPWQMLCVVAVAAAATLCAASPTKAQTPSGITRGR